MNLDNFDPQMFASSIITLFIVFLALAAVSVALEVVRLFVRQPKAKRRKAQHVSVSATTEENS